MSLVELLPAVRQLPRAEQVQLLHLLIDGLAASQPNDGIPEELRQYLPKAGSVIEMPPLVTTDANGMATLQAALVASKGAV